MNKENKQILGIVLILLAAIAIFAVFLSGGQDNADELCRDIFRGLVEGNQSMQNYIDWDNLNAFGMDIGATYSSYPNSKVKEGYRREFYRAFSLQFRSIGGTFASYTNWRIYKKSILGTIVAVDCKPQSKTILFTLSGLEKKKLTNIKWEGKK
jgi:hypothetical protein